VKVYEVFDKDGSPIGAVPDRYFARDNKQGGAWIERVREQSRLLA